jgi:hypothetical protein
MNRTLTPIKELLGTSGGGNRPRTPTPDEVALGDDDELVLELVQLGVALRKAEQLVRTYPAERIRRQIRYLPYRAPKKPPSLLIASIEHDYDAPAYAPK